MYCLQYSDPFAGDLFMETNNIPYYSLGNALNNLFLDSQLNCQHRLSTFDCNTVAIFKTSERNFKILTLIQEIDMAYHTHLEKVCQFLLKI